MSSPRPSQDRQPASPPASIRSISGRTISLTESGGLKPRISIFGKPKPAQLNPSPGETPLAVLRIQVVSCQDLPGSDLNGKSDPYVKIRLLQQRQKTPAVKSTLNPTWASKNATFDYPIYGSIIKQLPPILDIQVWDDNLLRPNTYLGEVSLILQDWFRDRTPRLFSDPANTPRWFNLESHTRTPAHGSIQLRIGFWPTSEQAKTADLTVIFNKLVDYSRGSTTFNGLDVFSAPPTQSIGTVPRNPSIDGKTLTNGDAHVTGNWSRYLSESEFLTDHETYGYLILEVASASDLPKLKNPFSDDGWDNDPFVVVSFNEQVYRTRIIRHELNPVWEETFSLRILKRHLTPTSPSLSSSVSSTTTLASPQIAFTILDWDRFVMNDPVGDGVLELARVLNDESVIQPDKETGLYPDSAPRSAMTMKEQKISLKPAMGSTPDPKKPPVLTVRARFEPQAYVRQRHWRHHLTRVDANHSKKISRRELMHLADSLNVRLNEGDADKYFKERGVADGAELGVEEVVVYLENAISGMEIKYPKSPLPEPEPIDQPTPPTTPPTTGSPLGASQDIRREDELHYAHAQVIDLEKAKEVLEKEKKDLTENLEARKLELEERIAQHTKEVEEWRLRVESVKTEMESVRKQSEENVDRERAGQAEMKLAHEELVRGLADVEKGLREKMESYEREVVEYRKRLEQVQVELETVKRKEEEVTIQERASSRQVVVLTQQLKETIEVHEQTLKLKEESYKKQIEEHVVRLSEVQTELQTVRSNESESKTSVLAITTQLAQYTQQTRVLETTLQDKEKELTAKVESYEKEVEAYRMKLIAVQQELETAKKNAADAASEQRATASRLSDVQDEVEVLRDELESLRVQYDDSKKVYAELQVEAGQLRKALADRGAPIPDSGEVTALRYELNKLQLERTALKSRISTVQNALEKQSDDIQTLEHTNHVLKHEIIKLRGWWKQPLWWVRQRWNVLEYPLGIVIGFGAIVVMCVVARFFRLLWLWWRHLF